MGGGYTDSVNTYSMAALEVLMPRIVGGGPWSIFNISPTWPEIAEHGELVLAFGGLARKNTQINNGGVGAHTVAAGQRRAREAGVEFVNDGPLVDDVARELHARWLPVRPNTDVALMLGLSHSMLAASLHDEDFLTRCCAGFDRYRAYLEGDDDGITKDADWASSITGIDAHVIEDLARQIATRRTLISVAWSLQRAHHGEQPYWAGVALAAMSGSMGRPGGGFATGYGTVHAVGTMQARQAIAALPQPANPVDVPLPVARIADCLLHPGNTIDHDGRRVTFPDIRLVYWVGGNPFHHHQDLNRLVRAWQEPETIVVQDAWWTPNARFADIVLPVATFLERNDFAAGMLDPWLSAMHKAADPPGDARTDYEIFLALADRLGFGEQFTEGRSGDEWVRELYERTCRMLAEKGGPALPAFGEFWRMGQVAFGAPKPSTPPAASFGLLRSDPQEHPLPTPSGRIQLFSEEIDGFGYDDCPGHPAWLEPAEWLGSSKAQTFPLHLISNQPRTRLHSQFDNGGFSQAAKIAGREPLRRLEPGRSAADDQRHAERRRALDGSLVRPGRAGPSRVARPSRQSERPDVGPRHVAIGPGADLADHARGGRGNHRPSPAGQGLRAPGDTAAVTGVRRAFESARAPGAHPPGPSRGGGAHGGPTRATIGMSP
jgi:biotin/methionine sulfoxide reductase